MSLGGKHRLIRDYVAILNIANKLIRNVLYFISLNLSYVIFESNSVTPPE